ncbi:MAG: transcription termination/antitermination NusG family protein [Verrucomicrobiota bacterium]
MTTSGNHSEISIPEDLKWRVLRAKPKGEHLAAQHLRREGFEAFCPRLRHQKKTTRGRVWFVEAMFPGYIFCRFSVRESLRHVVSTAFVSQALTFMHDAGSVSDALIEDLRKEFDEKETITVRTTVEPGDTVDVVDGPMRGSQAVVTEVIPGKERVRILLEFIGGLQEIEVPLISLITGRNPRQEAFSHRA